MDSLSKKRLDLYLDNYYQVRNHFKWKINYINKVIIAIMYSARDEAVDFYKLNTARNLIKNLTPMLSQFKGYTLGFATCLSMSEDIDETLGKTMQVYTMLRARRFKHSEYLVLSAYQIVATINPNLYKEVVDRVEMFQKGMKAAHQVITGPDDYVNSTLLALTALDVGWALSKIESIYQSLRKDFNSYNNVQSLAQTLVICGEDSAAKEKILKAKSLLKAGKLTTNSRLLELPTLGLLLAYCEPEDVAGEIKATYMYLRERGGFKGIIDKPTCVLVSMALSAFNILKRLPGSSFDHTINNSLTNLVVSEEISFIVALVASGVYVT
ncbi:MAG: DUF4003 domain-containing protein [Eubacteriaceae bacterium]|nr:DUF4003 domain-containing protein [Eubacteriaceae bacterium]